MDNGTKVKCPRCNSVEGEVIAQSPVPNKWRAIRCGRCNYLWRDCESLEGIEKITTEMISRAIEVRF